MNTAHEILSKAMTEAELQRNIEQEAKMLGWLCYHTWLSIHSAGGFPDLVLARKGKIIFIECKSQKGRPTNAQTEWAVNLSPHYFLSRPQDWLDGTIEKILK